MIHRKTIHYGGWSFFVKLHKNTSGFCVCVQAGFLILVWYFLKFKRLIILNLYCGLIIDSMQHCYS